MASDVQKRGIVCVFFMTKEFTRKVKGLKLIYFNILPFIEVNSHGEFFFPDYDKI